MNPRDEEPGTGAADRVIPRTTLRRRTFAAAALLLTIGAAAFSNSFTERFAGLDAKESIRDNPYITRLWPLTDAMSLPLLADTKTADAGSKGGTVVRRPILSLTFALNRATFGPQPWSFHLVNLAIHLTAGLLLLGVLRRTLAAPSLGVGSERALLLALAVAAIWLVHPLHGESVTYLVQRAESLMGCLLLATLYCAIRGFEEHERGGRRALCRRNVWYATSVAACALAVGTKEVAVVTPVLVLLYDGIFVSRSYGTALEQRRTYYTALAATWTIIALLIVLTLDDVGSDFNQGRNLAYALAQPYVILEYLRAAFWPYPLYVHVNTRMYDGLDAVRIALPTALVSATVAVGAWGVYRRRWYGFVAAWFFLILAPSSSVVAVSDIIQLHRMYLSLAAVVLLTVIGVAVAISRVTSPGRTRLAVGVTTVGVVVAVLATLTFARNRDFHGEFAMVHPADLNEAYLILANHYLLGGHEQLGRTEAQAMLDASPPAPRDEAFAHYLLGAFDDAAGNRAAARIRLERALELRPDLVLAHKRLGDIQLDAGETEAAEASLRRAVEIWPHYPGAWTSLGRLALEAGRLEEAQAAFERTVALEPRSATAHNNLAFVLARRGDAQGAGRHYAQAVALDASLALAHNNLGQACRVRGDLQCARSHFEAAVQADPGDAYARRALAELAEARGEPESALAQWDALLAASPGDASAALHAGSVLERMGRAGEAGARYEAAIALEPRYVAAHNALGTLLARQGRFAEAEPLFATALEIEPANADANTNLGVLYASQGRFDVADDHLRRALRARPNAPMINFNLALIAENTGRLQDAIAFYEAELAIEANRAATHLGLARVLERGGDLATAAEHYSRTLELEPGMVEAQVGLERARAGVRTEQF